MLPDAENSETLPGVDHVSTDSEASYRALFEAALDAVVIYDLDGVVVDANPAALDLFGVARELLVGRRTTPFFSTTPEQLAELRGRLRRDGQLRVELEIVRPDGSHRYVEAVTRAEFVPGRTMSIMRDVTARREAVERFAKAFHASPVPIVIVRVRDARYIEMNDAFVRLVARSRESMIGRTASELGIGTARTRETVSGHIRSGTARNMEVEIQRPTGEVRQLLGSTEAIEIGGEACLLSVLHDITEWRAAEVAKNAEEAKFRALVEHSDDVFMLLDQGGSITYASPAFTRVLGHPVEDWIGKNALSLVADDDAVGARDRLAAAFAAPGTPCSAESRIRHADGSVVEIESTTMNRLDDPNVRAIVVNARDVTPRRRTERELKKTEEQLRHSQKMEAIGSLAGGIAHDFNNLLSVVVGFVDIAMEELEAESPVQPHLGEVKAAALRAVALTKQLLAFSRRQILEPRHVNLNESIRGLDRMLRRIVGESIDISVQPGPALGNVLIDPGQFEQVVVNVVVNARDAMPTGGRLMLETSNVELDEEYAASHPGVAPGRYVLVTISDTGIGMDPGTQARIFEPFFTTKERGKGTGLGLATVFGIVKQHGGHIWVYSEPGRGTAFRIYFPRTDSPADPLPRAPVEGATLSGHETILLVEDEDMVRRVARSILRRLGYNVLDAANPGEAILICEEHPGKIELLLTDVVMPKMSGSVLAARLIKLKPEMRVLFMSGYTDDAIVHHGMLQPGVAFIEKPLITGSLARKLRAVLDAPVK